MGERLIVARIHASHAVQARDVRIILSDHPSYLKGAKYSIESLWHGAAEGYHVLLLPSAKLESHAQA